VSAYLISFILPVLINNKALIVSYEGRWHFPMLYYYSGETFGQTSVVGEPNYRDLKQVFEREGRGNWVIMPPYPYSSTESHFGFGPAPNPPSSEHWFGTDDRARDVLARLAYGFNVSLTFALIVTALGEGLGVVIGALLGYFGGKVDILGQRAIEVWTALPFLYTIIIVSSIIVPQYLPDRNLIAQPSFWLLTLLLVAFSWMSMTYYIRGEFYREKAKDYAAAAIAMGVPESAIIFRHILPNALTPVVSFAPFTVVLAITELVALDFLGFGLPAPTPSWGELIFQGMGQLTKWWLVLFPLGAMFLTLLLIVFVGEAVREAFDPKEYSRLR
jgi:microcin C transport system permease protein